MNYEWCKTCYICVFNNDYCSGNRDWEKWYMCVVEGSSSKKWAVAYELRNFLIKGFYRQGWKSTWISNNLLGSSFFSFRKSGEVETLI